MRVDIQSGGFLHHSGITRSSERISRVVVRFGDLDGACGTTGKFCKIRVRLEHAAAVLIADAGADL